MLRRPIKCSTIRRTRVSRSSSNPEPSARRRLVETFDGDESESRQYGAPYLDVIRRSFVIPGFTSAQFAIARWGRRFAISRRHREMADLSRLTRSRSDAQRFTNRGIDNGVSAG